MAVVGSVELVVVGFDGVACIPPELDRQLGRLRGRGALRVLDVLFVSRDALGRFLRDPVLAAGGDAQEERSGSLLWQLLVGDAADPDVPESLALVHDLSWETGIDIDTAEGIARLIEPGTSALLLLVEATWAADLLGVARRSGGFPLLFGSLEREAMFLVGARLASAADAVARSERIIEARAAATLDALAAERPSTAAGQVLAALVSARVLSDRDVGDALDALVSAGLVPSSLAGSEDTPVARRAFPEADPGSSPIR